MARRASSITPSTANSGAVSGSRTTPQIQDNPSARNRNTRTSPRPDTNVANVSNPRPNVPMRTPDRDSFNPTSANASNDPAHINNMGTPAVTPAKPIANLRNC